MLFRSSHTRNNVIIISKETLTKDSQDLLRTLVHEKIHIYQKIYKQDVNNYLQMNTFNWIITIAAALGAVIFIISTFGKLFRTWFHFIDDWYGDDDKPGVMERLEIGAGKFDQIDSDLKIIKAELFSNSGSSLRDAIDRIEADVIELKINQAVIKTKLEA